MNTNLRILVGLVLLGGLVLAHDATAQRGGAATRLRPATRPVTPVITSTPTPTANTPLDPFQTYAGVFLSDCANPNSARLTVSGGVLTFLDGERRVSGSRLMNSNSPAAVVDDHTLVGEVAGNGTMRFIAIRDASGEYMTIEGDPGVLDALGPDARRLQFRRCDTAVGAVPTGVTPAGKTTTPVINGPAMMTDSKFRTTYTKTLGFRARDPWLSTLEGPGPATRTVKIDGRNYVLVSSCKEHDCNKRNVVVLYSAAQNVVYGKLYEAGTMSYLGSPPATVARQLDALWKEAWRPEP